LIGLATRNVPGAGPNRGGQRISGDFKKARLIFEEGVAEDPIYPMYYYNLACADAGEKSFRTRNGIFSRPLTEKIM
jgi:hypothetical protein